MNTEILHKRRTLIKALMASWGSAGLMACGGGGGDGTSASTAASGSSSGGGGNGGGGGSSPITISAIPQIVFTGGAAATHAFSQYVQIPPGYEAPTYSLVGALPAGLSFDQKTGILSYDGSGSSVQLANVSLSVSANPLGNFVTSFALTSSVGGSLLPWTTGHFFRQGDVPNGETLYADVDDFQTVIRNRWPDGSVKFAVLSGRCNLSANVARTVQLTRVAASAQTPISLSTLAAANPQISVQVGGFGTVNLSSVIGTPHRQLLAGPVCSEWQYRLPVDSQLTVWLYVRLYKGGRIEFMASVENGWFDFTGAINKSAQIVVSGGGQTLYDSGSAIDIKHHTRVVCTTGHSGKLWIGGDPGVIPAHNTSYLQRTGAVPAYLAQGVNATTLNGLAQAYVPYAQHNLPGNSLGGGGAHPSIGWLPRWDACYVVTADARAYRAVLVNSFASAAYSYHFRHGTTGNVVAYADAPTTGIGQSAGSNSAYGGRAYYSGQYGTDWDISHGWIPGYVAYLLTGDWWHLEELQFVVKWVHYTSSVSYRGNATGLMVRNLQTRGTAWALRNCAMAAAITPDSDSERAAYCNAVGASLTWMRSYHTNGLGLFIEPDQAGWGDPGGQRTWMSDYVVGCVAWALDQKLLAGQQLADAQAVMNWCGAGLVQRMSDGTNPNGWHWARQAYSPTVSSAAFPQNQQQANLDANWGVSFQRWFGRANGTDLDNGVIYGGWTDERNLAAYLAASSWGAGYFEYAMNALAQCVNQGVPGAAAAFARITSASNYASCRNSLANDPTWGVGPRS